MRYGVPLRMDDLHETLGRFGLSPRETTIYLTLLSVGSAPASVLGKRTSMTRSTAQYTCQQLVKKGLLSVTQRNNTFLYVPEPPEKLLLLLDQQKRSLEDRAREVHRIIAPLKELMAPPTTLPTVRFYEGSEGIVQFYETILETRAPVYSFETCPIAGRGLPPRYPEEFERRRIERGICSFCIAPRGSDADPGSSERLREVRRMNAEKFLFVCDVLIFADEFNFCSSALPTAFCLSIRHPRGAESARRLFQCIWETLETPDTESC